MNFVVLALLLAADSNGFVAPKSPVTAKTTTGLTGNPSATFKTTTAMQLSVEDIIPGDLKIPDKVTVTLPSLSLPDSLNLEQELRQIQESFSGILNDVSSAGNAAASIDGFATSILSSDQVTVIYQQAVDAWDHVIQPKVVPLLEAAGIDPKDIQSADGIPSDLLLLLQATDVPPSALLLAASVTTYWMVSTVLSFGQGPPSSKPYPLQKYDPITAQEYFDTKPVQAIQRSLQIAAMSLGFGVKLITDKIEYVRHLASYTCLKMVVLFVLASPCHIYFPCSISLFRAFLP